MSRLALLFWLILVAATGTAMFVVKYQVQDLEEKIARTAKATAAEQHEIRMLTAEWAYLNRPESLDAMNRRYLSLIPVATRQLHAGIDDIPLRPAPPSAEEDLVAAAAAVETPVPPSAWHKPDAVLEAVEPKPGVVPAVARPGSGASAKSLDDLFARISASR
jgi:hypothetical protein